jgi:hypothetical protein
VAGWRQVPGRTPGGSPGWGQARPGRAGHRSLHSPRGLSSSSGRAGQPGPGCRCPRYKMSRAGCPAFGAGRPRGCQTREIFRLQPSRVARAPSRPVRAALLGGAPELPYLNRAFTCKDRCRRQQMIMKWPPRLPGVHGEAWPARVRQPGRRANLGDPQNAAAHPDGRGGCRRQPVAGHHRYSRSSRCPWETATRKRARRRIAGLPQALACRHARQPGLLRPPDVTIP